MRNMHVAELFDLLKAFAVGNRLLRKSPHWSPDEMQAWQFTRIRQLVKHAFENVPFYKDIYQEMSFDPRDLKGWDDFRRLPVVTKSQVIENYPYRILQSGLKPDDLIVSRSSGSSGRVLDIAYDGTAFTTYIMAGLRLYSMGFTYRPWHSQVYIYTSPYPMNSLFGLFPLVHVSTLTPIPEIVALLRERTPDLIVCYPSHLKQIAADITDRDRLVIKPKAISVNSEMSAQKERDELAAFFGCPVLDDYSSEELTRIAAQCTRHAYHVFEDINYMEVLDPHGTPTDMLGTLVGTNLHNTAMPMIRYQQDDLGTIRPCDCDCGWRFRELKDLQGRKNDSFQMPSGRVLTSGFLLDATYDFLLEDRTAIRDFCLIQQRLDLIELEIVPGPGWSNTVATRIVKRFESFLDSGVVVTIECVQECTKTKTGKRNPIINMMNRTGQP